MLFQKKITMCYEGEMKEYFPKNWPKGFPFFSTSYAENIPVKDLRLLLFPPLECSYLRCIAEKRVHRSLEIKVLGKDHPLESQRGLFATDYIPVNSVLGEYVGELTFYPEEQKVSLSSYGWKVIHPHYMFTVDAAKGGNELAFVNDFRGIENKPNVIPKLLAHGNLHYFCFVAARQIVPNEEILVDYRADI